MRANLGLACLVCAACGTAAGRHAPGRAAVALALAAAACAASLFLSGGPGRRRAALAAAAFCAWTAISAAQFSAIRNGVLPRLAAEGRSVTVEGRIVSPLESAGPGSSFYLKVTSLEGGRQRGGAGERVLVRSGRALPRVDYFPGVPVKVHGRLSLPGRNAARLLERGAACVMGVSSAGIQTRGPPDAISRVVQAARSWVSGRYALLFDHRAAGLLEGITLSKLDLMQPGLRSELRSCGLSHIVAVSGLHVGAAAALVLAGAAAAGLGKAARYSTAGLSALAVLALSGFRPAAARAAFMATAAYGGALAGRRYDPRIGLSVAGMGMLAANPRALFDWGFQYSFAAAAGIILAVGLQGRRPTGSPSGERVGGLRAALVVCSGAQLGLIPIMLARGEPVPVTALLANLLVVPVVGPILLSGWLAAALSPISLAAARPVALLAGALARYVMFVCSSLSLVPGGRFAGSALSKASLALYLLGLALLLAAIKKGSGLLRPGVAVTLALALALFSCGVPGPSSGRDTVTFLDVGQGDAVLATDSTGARVLVDGGPDPGRLMEKLEGRGVSRLDLAVSTHPHADHLAGLVEAVDRLPVGALLEPGLPPGSSMHRRLIDRAGARGVRRTTARRGQMVRVSAAMSLEVLRAPADLEELPEDVNDRSLVILLRVGGMKVLLTGDAGSEAQDQVVAESPWLRCDVLKVSHQGAADDTSETLLETCRPVLAAISVGAGNMYGHPSAGCLEMLAEHGIVVARTDIDGDIEVSGGSGRIGLTTGRRRQ